MRVVLLADVPSVGQRGQLKEVKDGFGRNYLIPKKLAVVATKSTLNAVQKQIQIKNDQRKDKERIAMEYKTRIASTLISLTKKANANQVLFDSVGPKDIVKLLQKNGIIGIQEHDIIGTPLKELGDHIVQVRLAGEYIKLRVQINEEL